MMQELSKTVGSIAPIASIGCFAFAAYAGRKYALAEGCKLGAAFFDLIGQENVAKELDKVSQDYWTEAKKTALRDLTAVAGFVALGIASGYAGAMLRKEEPPKPEPIPQPEPPLHIKIGVSVLNTLNDYRNSIVIIGAGGVIGFRRHVFKLHPATKLADAGLFTADKVAVVADFFTSRLFLIIPILYAEPVIGIPLGLYSVGYPYLQPVLVTAREVTHLIEMCIVKGLF